MGDGGQLVGESVGGRRGFGGGESMNSDKAPTKTAILWPFSKFAGGF